MTNFGIWTFSKKCIKSCFLSSLLRGALRFLPDCSFYIKLMRLLRHYTWTPYNLWYPRCIGDELSTFVRNWDIRKCRKKYHSRLKRTIRISLLGTRPVTDEIFIVIITFMTKAIIMSIILTCSSIFQTPP